MLRAAPESPFDSEEAFFSPLLRRVSVLGFWRPLRQRGAFAETSPQGVLFLGRAMASLSIQKALLITSLAGCVALYAALGPETGPENSGLRGRIVRSLGSARLVEGRLSGFSEAGTAGGSVSLRQLRELREELQRKFPSVELSSARGLVLLADKDPEGAVHEFERASSYPWASSEAFSDLAAAYLEVARQKSDPESLVKALVAAHRAVTLDPSAQSAQFNLALVLERLFLKATARNAWDRYLMLDSSSNWAREAKRHRAELAEADFPSLWENSRTVLETAGKRGDSARLLAVVREFPQQARLYAEEELLGSWAREAIRGGSGPGDRALALAEQIGLALATSGGDPMLRETVAAIRAQEVIPGRGLVQGHALFAHALEAYRDQRFTEALPEFVSSAALLERAGSPFYLWASLYAGICEYQTFQYQIVLDRLTRLHQTSARTGYRAVEGRVLWMLGLTHVVSGDLLESLRLYELSASAFRAAHEFGHLAAVDRLIAQNLHYLGRGKEVWLRRYEALEGLTRFRDPQRLQSALQESATVCLERGDPEAAFYFETEALGVARELDKPLFLASSLRREAELLSRLGRNQEALEALSEAKAQAARIQDDSVRRSAESDFLVAEGTALLALDPRAAVASVSRALEFYRATEYRLHSARLLLLRGKANEKIGDLVAAQQDYTGAVQAVEASASGLDKEDFRATFFGQARAIFSETVRFFAERNDAEQSLAYAERGRAQGLLADLARLPAIEIARHENRLSTLRDLQAAIPSDTALLEYQELPDRLLIWAITQSSIRLHTVRVTAARLATESDRFNQTILTNEGRHFRESAQRLYSLLVGPASESLKDAQRLIIIPDGSIHAVPFAALLDTGSGSFLVERYALGVAPSLAVWGMMRDRAGEVRERPGHVLVVGVSRFPRIGPASLSDLPSARAEAQHVADLYPGAVLLLDEQASRGAVLAGIPGSRVVHLATHAVIIADRLAYSFLALGRTSGDGQEETLTGTDLARTDWRGVLVVYLSACQTGDGLLTPSEGPMSLAHLLLGVGVGSVVASRWKMNDRDSEEVARAFHEHLRAGMDILAALQQAEVAQLRSARLRPAAWASLYAIGG